MELSQSEENYIKAIYSLYEVQQRPISTNDLAEQMQTKASSVTDMVKRLADKKLLKHIRYQGCSLTDEGMKVALKTIRKHRLWETFLVEKLNFGWDEVHPIAEQLEHIKSQALTDRLDTFLNHPKFDPHGDPIPDQDGNITKLESSCKLDELPLNQEAIVIGVEDGSPSFLRYLDGHEINLGTKLEVTEVFDFDDSRKVLVNGKVLNLSLAASSKITVQL